MFFPESTSYLKWLGVIFIRALKMIVVPLVVSSLITGVTNIGKGKQIGRIGLKTLAYYLSTSLIAILIGLVLVNWSKPGVGAEFLRNVDPETVDIVRKPISETLVEIIPTNIFQSLMQGDMLPIIFFSILFGIFINSVDNSKSTLLKNIFQSVFDVMMKITLFVLKFAPLGILGIVSEIVAQQSSNFAQLGDMAFKLLHFMLIVIIGLVVHFMVILPLILWLVGKVNPLEHYQAMLTPILTAFSTASSNGTLPITLETVEHKSGVSNKVASFTLPLGATINMDGTALYELVVAGFIAQIYGIELSYGAQFIMVATALLASIGTAAVPMASLVTMTIIFEAIGLPLEAIAIILPVDRILDHCRTTVNVVSDTCCATVIAKSEGEKINY